MLSDQSILSLIMLYEQSFQVDIVKQIFNRTFNKIKFEKYL